MSRWETLKARTWFREEQAEVTELVEALLAESARLSGHVEKAIAALRYRRERHERLRELLLAIYRQVLLTEDGTVTFTRSQLDELRVALHARTKDGGA